MDQRRRKEDQVNPIQSLLRKLVVATVTLYLLLACAGLYTYFQYAKPNKDALCTLRADLERRVDTTEDFLIENPKGTPGIPAGVLKKSVREQKRSIRALSNLDCE